MEELAHDGLAVTTDSEKATMSAKVFFHRPHLQLRLTSRGARVLLQDAETTRPPRGRASDSEGAHQSDQDTFGGRCTRH